MRNNIIEALVKRQDGKIDILHNHILLELFCTEIIEALGSRDKAEHWLEERFTPCFEAMIDEWEEENGIV